MYVIIALHTTIFKYNTNSVLKQIKVGNFEILWKNYLN